MSVSRRCASLSNEVKIWKRKWALTDERRGKTELRRCRRWEKYTCLHFTGNTRFIYHFQGGYFTRRSPPPPVKAEGIRRAAPQSWSCCQSPQESWGTCVRWCYLLERRQSWCSSLNKHFIKIDAETGSAFTGNVVLCHHQTTKKVGKQRIPPLLT